MGQMTTGVLYGAKIPKGVDVWGENEDGVLAQWQSKHDYHSIDWPEDSDIVGAWVAVAMAENSELELGDGPVSLAALQRSPQFGTAKRRWDAFVMFAAKQGVTFGEPELWIASTEVA